MFSLYSSACRRTHWLSRPWSANLMSPVAFRGYIVAKGHPQMDPVKVFAITTWALPDILQSALPMDLDSRGGLPHSQGPIHVCTHSPIAWPFTPLCRWGRWFHCGGRSGLVPAVSHRPETPPMSQNANLSIIFLKELCLTRPKAFSSSKDRRPTHTPHFPFFGRRVMTALLHDKGRELMAKLSLITSRMSWERMCRRCLDDRRPWKTLWIVHR